MKWIRVELHNHTIASDGDMLPHELVENAKVRKYKAIAVTDHNTTAQCQEVINAGKEEGIVVIPGIEWTTFWGHIVVLGGHSDIDWRTITLSNIDEKIARAKELGDIVIVAHPKRLGTPFCSECRFLYDLKHWENVAGYEVWSHYSPFSKKESEIAKEEWGELLLKGNKIAAVYGYDWHTPDEDGPEYAYTYVGIEEDTISVDNILNAIRKGRTYISMGVEVNGSLKNRSGVYSPGDEIKRGKYNINLEAKVANDYAKKYDCEIKGVRMLINEKVIYAKRWHGDSVSIPITLLDKGIFRIEMYGTVEGKDGDVLVCSPYYIK